MTGVLLFAIVVCCAAKRVMYRVQVLHHLATSGMSDVALRMMASCVYYDLSLNGSELLTYVSMKDEIDLQFRGLEERIQLFGLHGTTDCLPSYERLTPCKSTSAKQSVDK